MCAALLPSMNQFETYVRPRRARASALLQIFCLGRSILTTVSSVRGKFRWEPREQPAVANMCGASQTTSLALHSHPLDMSQNVAAAAAAKTCVHNSVELF